MALLTDGDPNDDGALRVYETSILDVAHVEMINLQTKLNLATQEISQDVLDLLLDHARTSDPQAIYRRRLGVSDVVVTQPLKRWHALHTLAIVYRDAYNNQLNDRYQPKWDEYRQLAKGAWDQTMRYGIGLVSMPVPIACAPAFSIVSGTTTATTYYVSVTWVSATGEEGTPSNLTTFATTEGSFLVVQAVNPPPVAAGWNVYIGLLDCPLALQNSVPLAIGQSFTLAPALGTGAAPGDGQTPDFYITGGRMLRRG